MFPFQAHCFSSRDLLRSSPRFTCPLTPTAFLTQGSGVVVCLVTFGLYSLLEGAALEPARVFSGLALFNQLTVPLFILPIIVSHTIRAKVGGRGGGGQKDDRQEAEEERQNDNHY